MRHHRWMKCTALRNHRWLFHSTPQPVEQPLGWRSRTFPALEGTLESDAVAVSQTFERVAIPGGSYQGLGEPGVITSDGRLARPRQCSRRVLQHALSL